jgi:HSP20 family protein
MYNQETTTDSQNQQGFGPKNHGCGGPFGKRFGGKFAGKSPWGKMFGGPFANRKAANIEENDSSFIISLYAAGLTKSNFKISVTNDVLTIAYNTPKTDEASQSQYTHLEYEPGSFERSFQLNGKVLTENISAAYTDGVMVVTLPKNPAQEVNVN